MREGIKCSIWTYVRKDDVSGNGLIDIKAVIELGRQLKVWKLVILFPMASGNWLCGAENILTKEEREKVRTLHTPPFVVMEFPSEDASCNAGRRMVYVTPKGDVSPCPTIPVFFGNIHQEPFRDILKKVNRDFVESKRGGCGECVMNQDYFRQNTKIEVLSGRKGEER